MWLEIEIDIAGENVRLSGRGSRDERPPAHTMAPTWGLARLQAFSGKVARAVRGGQALDPTVIAEAQALHEELLKGELRDVLARLREAANDAPLLIRLFLRDRALEAVPWEALCRPGTTEGFLGTDPKILFARGVTSSDPWKPREVRGAVRVLAIAPGSEAPALAVLKEALGPSIEAGDVERLEPIAGPDISARVLFDRLRRVRTPHIVHWIGHGGVDVSGRPELRLADDEDGEEVWVTAEAIARELSASFREELRLVVLEACEGAAAGALGSAAEILAGAGADAVVVHLWPVKADVARTCSREIYRALTGAERGSGDIGASVAAARRTLLAHSAEAFSPILFLRGAGSVIFDFQSRRVGEHDTKQAGSDAARDGVESDALIFNLVPAGDSWTTVGPTPGSAPHVAPSPLHDADFLEELARFRDLAALPVVVGAPEGIAVQASVRSLAASVAARLTGALLSDAARAAIAARIHAVHLGRARLAIRVEGTGEESDAALALPWELLLPEPGDFPVHASTLDVVREAVVPGASELPEATGPLVLAVSIAAPEDASALSYEDEAYRLQRALEALGHDVVFADLGDVEDLVRVADAVGPGAIHFSGHGLPGGLVFENELGLAAEVKVEDLVGRLNLRLATRPGRFPRFFYLASCHGASGAGDKTPGCRADASPAERCAHERHRALGKGPSTAATLHRSGFVQVLGYFGPISDVLSTRTEEAFYGAVAAGKTTLAATAEARASMGKEIALGDARGSFPFAWTQLALYHRGPDRALALPGKAGAAAGTARLQREQVQVSGLPLLRHGFIGRRSTLHRIRRRLEEGQRLFVIQGLGGLGKTALATHLLAHVLAPAPADQLILACGGLDVVTMDPATVLWRQVEEHAERHRVPGWEARAKRLREEQPEAVVGFERAVAMLREARPSVVVYADNLETLQEGPAGDDAAALGSWSAAGKPVWEALERLSAGGWVLVTTRYGWKRLAEKAWVRIDPMREADVVRMVDTWANLAGLPRSVQAWIARRVDGHPRTVEFLDTLVGDKLEELGPGYEVRDAWAELVEPVLPATDGKVTESLLLEALWGRLSDEAQAHARGMSVLRRPAPRPVVDALGSGATTGELIRTGVVTQFREQMIGEAEVTWVDRWGMHSVVVAFVAVRAGEEEKREANRKAGQAFCLWMKQPGARWSEQLEGIAHFQTVGEGDQAWPMVEQYAGWLRDRVHYWEARVLLEGCEAAGTSKGRLGRALRLLGMMRRYLGERSDEVRGLLNRALGLAETVLERAYSLHELGALSKLQGKYGEAETLLRQSLALQESERNVECSEYGTSLQELAEILQAQGKYGEAVPLLRQSLAIQGKTLGVEHPNYGAALHALAGVLQTLGEYAEAELMLRQSLAINENAVGVEHPNCGASLNVLAVVLRAQGKYDEAEPLHRQSLAILERALGVNHPDYGTSCYNLAVVLAWQERAAEAEPLAERALLIAQRVHGSHHPDTAQILGALAQIQHALHMPEATTTAQRALDILTATLGDEHPITQDAAPILRRIALGSPAPAPIEPRILAALERARTGDTEGAIHALEALAEEAERAAAPGYEATARVVLAQLLAASGQPLLATVQVRAALAIAERLGDEAAVAQFRTMLATLEAPP